MGWFTRFGNQYDQCVFTRCSILLQGVYYCQRDDSFSWKISYYLYLQLDLARSFPLFNFVYNNLYFVGQKDFIGGEIWQGASRKLTISQFSFDVTFRKCLNTTDRRSLKLLIFSLADLLMYRPIFELVVRIHKISDFRFDVRSSQFLCSIAQSGQLNFQFIQFYFLPCSHKSVFSLSRCSIQCICLAKVSFSVSVCDEYNVSISVT